MTFAAGKSVRSLNIAADYGAVGDNATDNATALLNLRADLLAAVATRHQIVAPGSGTYRTSNNRWPMGVKYIDIIAPDGATITGTANNGWNKNGIWAHWGDPFDDTGDQAYSGASRSHVSGFRFDTIAAGATVLTMTTPGEESNFTAGDRVLLHGYCQQFTAADSGGYPPNLRWSEHAVVASVGSGTVTLVAGTLNAYDDRWPDFDDSDISISYGKPRILNLDRTNYTHPKLVRIRGLRIGINPNLSSADYIWLTGERCLLSSVRGNNIFPTCSEDVGLYKCHADHYIEIDKCLGDVVVQQCRGDLAAATAGGGGLRAGTGARSIIVDGGTYEGEMRLAPRQLVVRGAAIVHSTADGAFGDHIITQYHTAAWPVEKATFANVAMVNTSPAGVIKRGISQTFALRAYTVDGVSGSNILIAMGGGGEEAAMEIMVGDWLILKDGTNGGKVGDIYHDGGSPGNLVLEPDVTDGWSTPSISEVYYKQPWREVVNGGGNRVRGDPVPVWGNPVHIGTGSRTLTTPEVDWDLATRSWYPQGFIDSLTINVTRAYTGTDGTAEIRVKRVAGSTVTVCTINLKIAGSRNITTSTSSGAQTGDTLTPANLDGYAHEVIVETDDGVDALQGTASELPLIKWSLDVRPFGVA